MLHPRLKNDTYRTITVVLIVVLSFVGARFLPALTDEATLSPLLMSIGVGIALAIVSHITRRVLFPYIDLKMYAQKALETPQGAATVFLGVCLVLGVLIWSGGAMMR